MFEKEQEATPCGGEEATTTEEAVSITCTHEHISSDESDKYAQSVLSVMQQGDTSKAKNKVWQNKNKGTKKTAKSKKKKLTKKKAAPAKTKQANGNVAGNVSVCSSAHAVSYIFYY